MKNLMFTNSRFRVLTAATLILLFTFTGLFTTYQSSKDVTAAYASGSNDDEDRTPECIAARETYKRHLKATAPVCVAAIFSVKAKVACAAMLCTAVTLKQRVIEECGFWDSGV